MNAFIFEKENYENQLATLMLESLEKAGIISVTSKKLLEEYIWKDEKNAEKQPAR